MISKEKKLEKINEFINTYNQLLGQNFKIAKDIYDDTNTRLRNFLLVNFPDGQRRINDCFGVYYVGGLKLTDTEKQREFEQELKQIMRSLKAYKDEIEMEEELTKNTTKLDKLQMKTEDRIKKGKSVEHYIISQLLENNFDVYVPIVDTGIDIVIKSPDGAYIEVQIKSLTVKPNNIEFYIKDFKPKSNFFIVCHNLVENNFFVMPSSVFCKHGKIANIKGKIMRYMTHTQIVKYDDFKNDGGLKLLERAIKNPKNRLPNFL